MVVQEPATSQLLQAGGPLELLDGAIRVPGVDRDHSARAGVTPMVEAIIGAVGPVERVVNRRIDENRVSKALALVGVVENEAVALDLQGSRNGRALRIERARRADFEQPLAAAAHNRAALGSGRSFRPGRNPGGQA